MNAQGDRRNTGSPQEGWLERDSQPESPARDRPDQLGGGGEARSTGEAG